MNELDKIRIRSNVITQWDEERWERLYPNENPKVLTPKEREKSNEELSRKVEELRK